MFQQTVQRFNLIRPVCNTQVVEGLQRPTITPGAELIHVIPTCPVSVFRQRDYLKKSVYSASLVSFLKGHKSFQSTQSTLYSSIPSFPMPSIMSILYQIKKKQGKNILDNTNIDFTLFLIISKWKDSLNTIPFPHKQGNNLDVSSSSPQQEIMSWPWEPEMRLQDVSSRILPPKAPQMRTPHTKTFVGGAKGDCWFLTTDWEISKFIWNSDANTKTHMETDPSPSNLDDHGGSGSLQDPGLRQTEDLGNGWPWKCCSINHHANPGGWLCFPHINI